MSAVSTDPNVTIAAWTIVAGVSAAATSIVAIVTLLLAGRDSRERTRPVIVVEYRVPHHAYRTLELVVRNAGISVARNVRVTFDPELEARPDDDLIRTSIIRRYEHGIPAIGPGQELANIVSFGQDGREDDVPSLLRVHVEYQGIGKRHWYEDDFVLAEEVYRHHTYQTTSASVEGRLKAIKIANEKSAKSLERIARAVAVRDREAEARRSRAIERLRRRAATRD